MPELFSYYIVKFCVTSKFVCNKNPDRSILSEHLTRSLYFDMYTERNDRSDRLVLGRLVFEYICF